MKTVRIVLADDHIMFREGLKALIEAQPDLEVVGEAGDGYAALEQVKTLTPDLLLLDISMPELNGIQLMKRLGKEAGAPRVLVITGFSESAYVRQMLVTGAAGFVLKRSGAEVLISAVRAVVAGGTYIDPNIAGRVVSSFLHGKKPRGSREGDALSERESEVLRRVAQGYSNKEIAAQLELSVKTVETHKSNLMQKLGLRSRAEIVRYALQQGWLQAE